MRHSERSTFNSCPYKFRLEKVGLRRCVASPRSEDRTFGFALHAALDLFYKNKRWSEVIDAYTAVYPAEKEYKTKAKDFQSGLLALEAYRDFWSEQDKLWEVLGSEVADQVTFNEEEHSLHIDLIAKNKQTGEIYAWDHKTTDKALGKGFWKKYELDSQVTRYTKWVMDKYGSCGGFIINGIQVGHRERAYKGEPAGYYQKFERQPFSRNAQQIKAWEDSERDWASLIDYCQATETWPKHLGSLCGWCDFYELCMSADNESVRETLYTTEPLGQEETFNVVDETEGK